MSRKYIYLLLFTVTVGLAVITFYYYLANFGGAFSKDANDWGNFGSYIAGTLGIVLSTANFVFLYITFREQKVTTDRQQFENSLFSLLKIHQDFVGQSSDYKKKIDFETTSDEKLVGYELLDYFWMIEKAKMDELLGSGLRRWEKKEYLSLTGKYLLNYNLRNNKLIQSKEYLTAINESILEMYTYIRDSKMLGREDKAFYYGILLRSLRQSEKFFLFAFYIQEKNGWKKRNLIGDFDFKLLCNPDKMMTALEKQSNIYKYPQSFVGLRMNPHGSYVEQKLAVENWMKVFRGFCYTFFSPFNQVDLAEIEFVAYFNDQEIRFTLGTNEVIDGVYLYLGEILDAYINKVGYSASNSKVDDPIIAFLKENDQIEFSLNFLWSFMDGEAIQIRIFDSLKFKLVGEVLEMECGRPYNASRFHYGSYDSVDSNPNPHYKDQ